MKAWSRHIVLQAKAGGCGEGTEDAVNAPLARIEQVLFLARDGWIDRACAKRLLGVDRLGELGWLLARLPFHLDVRTGQLL